MPHSIFIAKALAACDEPVATPHETSGVDVLAAAASDALRTGGKFYTEHANQPVVGQDLEQDLNRSDYDLAIVELSFITDKFRIEGQFSIERFGRQCDRAPIDRGHPKLQQSVFCRRVPNDCISRHFTTGLLTRGVSEPRQNFLRSMPRPIGCRPASRFFKLVGSKT
jgi:hypothetical protein